MPRERRNYKKEVEELSNHRQKLVEDLVNFAVEWQKIRPGLSIHTNALGNYILINEMSNKVMEMFTHENEN